jgi:outer membrane protein assembly factor BamB
MGRNERSKERLRRHHVFVAVLAALAAAVALVATVASGAGPSSSWSMSGQGITNWRYQPDEAQINATNAGSLKPAWAATLGGDISATPAVVDGVAYVPDWGGKLTAINTQNGSIIWQSERRDARGRSGSPESGLSRRKLSCSTPTIPLFRAPARPCRATRW